MYTASYVESYPFGKFEQEAQGGKEMPKDD
jgi:hypothetical protein